MSDNRLGSQVDDHFGFLPGKRSLQRLEIAYVARNGRHSVRYAGEFEEAGFRRRGKRITAGPGAESLKPKGEPTALEAGMARQKYSFSAPKISINWHSVWQAPQKMRSTSNIVYA